MLFWMDRIQQQRLKSVIDEPSVLGNIEKVACFTNTEKVLPKPNLWPLWSFLVVLLHCGSAQKTFTIQMSMQAPACQSPICKGSFLLTQSLCSRSFSVRWSAVIFPFGRQSHWDSVCCFTRQWKSFKRNGLLLVCASTSTLSWEVIGCRHFSSTLHRYRLSFKTYSLWPSA